MKCSKEHQAKHNLERKAIRADQIDPTVQTRLEKRARINLGLELMRRRAVPGVGYDLDEIAYWAGCSANAIFQIQLKALRRLAVRLHCHKDALLRELVQALNKSNS
jgi:hypothetical protein